MNSLTHHYKKPVRLIYGNNRNPKNVYSTSNLSLVERSDSLKHHQNVDHFYHCCDSFGDHCWHWVWTMFETTLHKMAKCGGQ